MLVTLDLHIILAKNKANYADPKAWKLVHDLTEAFQYYLLKASNELAKERGACEYFDRTKYSDGILPIDTYKKDVDSIVENKLNYDWKNLRTDIKKHGLTAQHIVRTDAFREQFRCVERNKWNRAT